MVSQRILVAYQDDRVAQSILTYFQDAGYRVDTATMVSDVLRKVKGGTIEIILMDDELEGIRAYDLVPVLKGMNGGVQVIVVSSEERLGFVRRLRGAGIFYHAMKPVDLEELKSAVECAFEKVEKEKSAGRGILPTLVPGRVTA
jgi:DNA-binding NtrC family response regulator